MSENPKVSLALLSEYLIELGYPQDDGADISDKTVGALGLDSLTILELLMLVEERTGIEVPVEQVTSDTTLAALVSLAALQAES